jgi:hypothetical protein
MNQARISFLVAGVLAIAVGACGGKVAGTDETQGALSSASMAGDGNAGDATETGCAKKGHARADDGDGDGERGERRHEKGHEKGHKGKKGKSDKGPPHADPGEHSDRDRGGEKHAAKGSCPDDDDDRDDGDEHDHERSGKGDKDER